MVLWEKSRPCARMQDALDENERNNSSIASWLKSDKITKVIIVKFDKFDETFIVIYAVKVQRSLAPLSWFPGSRKPTVHVHQCCKFQSYMRRAEDCMPSPMKFTSEIYIAWTTFLGSTTTAPHGPRLWRLTLTAYYDMLTWVLMVLIYFSCQFIIKAHVPVDCTWCTYI